LDRSRGNISETARLLGLTRRGLYLKLRRLGLDARSELDTH
jgi:transcriptional regulator of acetoin/glycerol metabolism